MIETSIPQGLERRTEDFGLITGRSHYVDDIRSAEGRPAALHMVVVRSPYAHAKILDIQLDEARAVPGVFAVFTGAELVQGMRTLDTMPVPDLKKPERRPMAVDIVRYVGDPVAVVLAENIYAAIDARDLVDIDYEPLPSVTDSEAALASDAPLLYDEFGSNVAFHHYVSGGDIQKAFERADRTVKLRIVNQRVAPSSLEARACLFDYDAESEQFSAWSSSQAIYTLRTLLASFLNLKREQIRVRNAQVGGGFGAKTSPLGEEIIAAALALRLARPVKWIEDRSENLIAHTHGRGQINYIEAAVQNDGRLLGLKVHTIADLGAFLANTTSMVPTGTPHMLNGPYRIEAVESQVVGAFTNKVPTAAYRGAGRPEATYILERTINRIADELGMDPAEVRRRNVIAPNAFPYHAVTGMQYDSGNYEAALDKALELVDYTGWRAKQREQRKNDGSRLLGIGLATFIEITGGGGPARPGVPKEAATVRIRRDGTILVQSGVAHNGQGHFTAFAQIAAQVFHLSGSKVEVQMNDTALPGFGIGTFGSRTTAAAGSVVLLAAEAVREKALHLAAQQLEAAPDDLVLEDGKFTVRGVPQRSINLGTLAQRVEEQPDLISHEAPNPANGVVIEGLAAWHDFTPSGPGFSSGTHIAVVEVDTTTGETDVLTYVAVDDGGRILNSYLAEAQIHGAIAQGIGQALYEEVAYDENGQPLTSTFQDYTLPNAEQVPEITTGNVESPSPTNPLGAKGVGEAGCIAAPPAVVNAVLDALSVHGITSIDMPLKPEKVWALLQAASAGTLKQDDPTPPPVFVDAKQVQEKNDNGETPTFA